MPRIVRCAGSLWAEHGLPEEDSEWSAEGTELHRLTADPKLDRSHLKPAQIDLVDRALQSHEEILDAIYKDRDISKKEPFLEGHERELLLRRGIRPLISGHCDYWRYFPRLKFLFVEDNKFGFLEVTNAAENVQLRTYGVQGAGEWDTEWAFVAINQPRLFSYNIASYDRKTLVAAKDQLIWAVDAAMQKDAPRTYSEEACRYCKAKLLCDTYKARTNACVPLAMRAVADLSDEEMEAMYTAVKMSSQERFADAVKMEMRKRVLEGRMPGYEMKPNAPRRKVTDALMAAGLLQKRLTYDEVLGVASLPLDGLTSTLRKKHKLTEKEAKAELDELLKVVIQLSESEPSIVKVNKTE
jgi:hypothetical protein